MCWAQEQPILSGWFLVRTTVHRWTVEVESSVFGLSLTVAHSGKPAGSLDVEVIIIVPLVLLVAFRRR